MLDVDLHEEYSSKSLESTDFSGMVALSPEKFMVAFQFSTIRSASAFLSTQLKADSQDLILGH